MKRTRVAILYGGPSPEHEVSVVSARCVLEAIDRDCYEVVPIAIAKDGRWLLPERGPDRLQARGGSLPAVDEAGERVTLVGGPDGPALAALDGRGFLVAPLEVAFPLVHGPYGEDGTLQALLEAAGLPYVGAGVSASALGMDKEFQKVIFASAGIPVVRHAVVREPAWRAGAPDRIASAAVERVDLPCFTKPANLGSSIGIRKCATLADVAAGIEEALRFDRKALVEEAIDGRELECAVLGNDEPEASVVGEIVPAGEFYDYRAKYLDQGSRVVVPADVPAEVADEVRGLSARAFAAIGCAGMARVDFFLDRRDGRVLLNEINTIPGFTPISMYPKLWEASGLPYAKLIDRLVELALERHRR